MTTADRVLALWQSPGKDKTRPFYYWAHSLDKHLVRTRPHKDFFHYQFTDGSAITTRGRGTYLTLRVHNQGAHYV